MLVEIDLIHKGIKTRAGMGDSFYAIGKVEIDLIHKGIKTRPPPRSGPDASRVEIDLIHKGIKTQKSVVLLVQGIRRNRPDS